jgi:hypothetical protein
MQIMRHSLKLALPALLFLGTAAARANSVTFELTGTFVSGSTISGIVDINTISGTVLSVDATVTAPDSLSFNHLESQECIYASDLCVAFAGENNNTFPSLNLLFAAGTLVGYDGGELGTNAHPIGNYRGDIQFYNTSTGISTYDNMATGSLTATPEPSSLMLLGTGVAGLAGAIRRRLK